MKSIKYILSVWAILSLSIFCFSCMDEEVPKNNQLWCDGKTLVLNLNAPATQIVSPMSKSAQADTVMTDLNVLIYNEEGTLREGHYYDSKNSTELIAALQKGQEKQLDIDLGENVKGTVYAIANYGSEINDGSGFGTESSIKEATFALNDKQPKLYMYAEGRPFDVSFPDRNKVSMSLERIYSLVTVQIVKNLRQPTSGSFDVEPLSVQIKNIPTQGQFAANNLIGANNVGCLVDGEMLSRISEDDKNFLEVEHANAQAFYLYENRQPEGSSLNNNTDQTTKTPYGLPADEIISVIKQNRTCSYIEVRAKYIRNGNPEGVGSGDIIYRFFLGKDIYKDFDIERNTHYQVTLTLNGKGGADEATWRVETALIGEIQAPDVYIGYRQGSETRMYITGTGIEHIKNISAEITHTPAGGSNKGFIVSEVREETLTDGSTRHYVEIEADATNTHDYDKKVGQVTFSVDGNGIKRDFTAKVYQVPRLVDPIAFYKKADNVAPVHIRVKEYDPNQRAYIDLNSKGPWTATIKHSAGADNNWYKIYNTDESGNELSGTAQSSEDGVISGEGPVQFGYTPLSVNGNTDGDEGVTDGARYGMILVRYHNDWCEHEIYLRQGYQPTIMGDEDYAWSMFNCLGKKSESADEVGEVTAYPTQTGWLFNGGIDISMHPFIPRYGENDFSALVYSNGKQGYQYSQNQGSVNAWGYKENVGETDLLKVIWRGERGPCPEGYVVPTATTYRTLTDKTEIYTGYVHDDDPVKGWRYGADGEGAIVEDNNHCNPAKGTLFVDKNNRYTNVFFNYGKGVKTDIVNDDPLLIPEIGVGHRYDGEDGSNFIKLTGGYDGFYWNGTPFWEVPVYNPSVSGGANHMGKVHFGYNVFSKEPNLLDVPGYNSGEGPNGVPAVGIDRHHNGSFVRCVRDIKPLEYPTITLNGKFYQNGSLFTGTFTIEFYLKTNVAEFPKADATAKVIITNGVPDNPIVTIEARGEVADKVLLRVSAYESNDSFITELGKDTNKELNSWYIP